MNFQEIRHRADHVRGIPLQTVLLLTGAEPDRYDKAKWRTGKGMISCNGMKFMNWNLGVGGGGAIDLAMHLNDLGFKAAVEWLSNNFSNLDCRERVELSCKPNLILPPKNGSKLPRVKHYLVHERAIPAFLIQSLIESGTLYADSRSNAVFLLHGKDNSAVGAELRGTTAARWRGMAPGSQKDLGYFSAHDSRSTTIVLCESAIDALSCFALHPRFLCISTSGARSNPPWLPSLVAQGYDVYCGFDSDSIGDSIANDMIALYPSIKRLRPTQHDWNDVLKFHG